MKILLACEFSGIVRDAFAKKGHDAWSCDIIPSSVPGNHIQTNVLNIINDGWDMMIAHPPCTYLCKAQFHLLYNSYERMSKASDAIEFVKALLNAPINKIAIENPIGILSTNLRKPDQIIFPWWFGDKHSKDICLWLKNLPPLIATCYNTKRIPISNHVNSRMSQEEKSKIRSTFFPFVAAAMANQWS